MDWKFLVGFGIAVVFFFVPYAVKDMPAWVTWPGIVVGFLFLLWGLFPNHNRISLYYGLIFIAFVAAIFGTYLWYHDNVSFVVQAESNKPTLPIATSQMSIPYLQERALFNNDPEKDLPVLLLEDVFIKNTSLTNSLTMKMQLYIEVGRSQNFAIEATGSDGFGKVLGKNDYGTSILKRKFGEVPPERNYILSPVTINPQETIHGQIPFVLRLFTKGQLETIECGALARLGTGCAPWNYTLKFIDVISENETKVSLPGRLDEKK